MSIHTQLERAVFLLATGGFLFSGYLSGVKFFTETCAFNESCPYFIGYPACYFGFAMFTVIFVLSGLHVFQKINGKTANEIVLVTALLGILFAGYYTLIEIPVLFSEGLGAYILGLPTCALGLIFFAVIFGLSVRLRSGVDPR